MNDKLIKIGDKVIIANNCSIEDFVEEGEEVTIIKVKRKGEKSPFINGGVLSEDHYWIDKIGKALHGALIRETFK